MINYFGMEIVNDTNGYVSVGILMNLISWSQDGQLKTLMRVISVSSNLPDLGRSGRVENLDQSLEYL